MYKFTLLIAFLIINTLNASAQLTAGDIMFVGFNADRRDGLSIVAMVDIPANTIIYFNDNEWNELPIGAGGAFNNNNEPSLTWNTGPAVIPAGMVVDFISIRRTTFGNYGVDIGTITGTMSLRGRNEVIYAFLGSSDTTPTTFLSAIGNDTLANPDGSIVNTGLTEGVNAISFGSQDDVIVYSGSTVCDPAIINCQAGLVDPSNWSGEGGSGNQSNNGIFPDSPSDVPDSFSLMLPIQLISFDVDPYEEDKVELQWATATEINNNYFTIERSINAEHWEIIENIDGAGDSYEILFYTTIDENPNYGQSYYRLKQTDFDGAFTYSDIVTYKNNAKLDMLLYPNPTTYELTIAADNIDQANVYFFDRNGLQVHAYLNSKSESKLRYNVSDLTNGLYILRTEINGAFFTSKFIKQ